MADNVSDTLEQIQQFLKADLAPVFSRSSGGHYAAALLIAVACEALSLLTSRPNDAILTDLLVNRGLDRVIAKEVHGCPPRRT